MSAFGVAEAFVAAAMRASDMGELTALLSEAARELGFDHVTLMHHVNLAASSGPTIAYSDYPMNFLSVALSRRYFSDDPILAACQRTAAPFLWSQVRDLTALNDRQREILAGAARAGLEEGLTVPLNVTGEPPGSCSFALARGRRLPRDGGQAAHWVAAFAFEQGRRLVGLARSTVGRPQLSGRQFDCVVLAGRGKSDTVIAQLLDISPATVHQHIETAKRRFGVATRPQLVTACLADGQLTFTDVLG